jgi:integrase
VRVLSEFFGNLLLSQITRVYVEEFKQSRRARLLSPQEPVSAATCNRELACLRHILRLAVEERLRESSPLVKLYKEHGSRARSLSEEKYQRFLEASSPHLRRLLLCAYETGMRAGEIKGLT